MIELCGLPPGIEIADGPSGHSQGNNVEPGSLWVLSWDATYLALALVAAARSGYVLAWPVSAPGEAVFSPALRVGAWPSGAPMYAWPTRETGIGLHLLHRRIATGLPADSIRHIARALDDGVDPGLPFAAGRASDAGNRQADVEMIDHWATLCYRSGKRYYTHPLAPAEPISIYASLDEHAARCVIDRARQIAGLDPVGAKRRNAAVKERRREDAVKRREREAREAERRQEAEHEASVGAAMRKALADRAAHERAMRDLMTPGYGH